MSAASRRKGLTGEREVSQMFAEVGFDVRGLEGTGDLLAIRRGTLPILPKPLTAHVEVKRYHDRARWPEWWEQTSTEAPQGVPPLLCTRADRGEWLVMLRLADLLASVL